MVSLSPGVFSSFENWTATALVCKVSGNRCWFVVYVTVLAVTSEWHSKHELEGMWKEYAMTRFEALSCRLPPGTEETDEGVQSE